MGYSNRRPDTISDGTAQQTVDYPQGPPTSQTPQRKESYQMLNNLISALDNTSILIEVDGLQYGRVPYRGESLTIIDVINRLVESYYHS